MEQNSSTQSWPFPGKDTPGLGEMHLRVYPDGWDAGRTADVAALASRMVAGHWSVGVALCDTPSHKLMNTSGLAWSDERLEIAQVRDLVDLAKIVYKLTALHSGKCALIIDDWMRLATDLRGGHDDATAALFIDAVLLGDLEAIGDMTGLDYAAYTGATGTGVPMALIVGARFRGNRVGLYDIMGGAVVLERASSVISFYEPEYTSRGSVNCEVRCLKARSGQMVEPTQVTRTADGMWRRGSWKRGF
jgi:drug/metabolite transporter superfamily protein YnfA